MATSVVKHIKKIRDSVPASSAKVIDTVELSKFKSLRYFVTGWSSSKTKALNMTVVNDGGFPSDSVFSNLGTLSYGISANLVGSNVEIEITNNETDAIIIEMFKITSKP